MKQSKHEQCTDASSKGRWASILRPSMRTSLVSDGLILHHPLLLRLYPPRCACIGAALSSFFKEAGNFVSFWSVKFIQHSCKENTEENSKGENLNSVPFNYAIHNFIFSEM
jgi:hypothetical protein